MDVPSPPRCRLPRTTIRSPQRHTRGTVPGTTPAPGGQPTGPAGVPVLGVSSSRGLRIPSAQAIHSILSTTASSTVPLRKTHPQQPLAGIYWWAHRRNTDFCAAPSALGRRTFRRPARRRSDKAAYPALDQPSRRATFRRTASENRRPHVMSSGRTNYTHHLETALGSVLGAPTAAIEHRA